MKEITDYLLTLGWTAGKYMGADEIVSPDGDFHVMLDDPTWELSKASDRDDDDGVARGYWKPIAEGETLEYLKTALAVLR